MSEIRKNVRFSVSYSIVHEREFNEALQEGNSEKALKVLESMPLPITMEDKVRRQIVCVMGAGAIIDSYRNMQQPASEEDGELKRYRELGDVDNLVRRLKEEYEELKNVL